MKQPRRSQARCWWVTWLFQVVHCSAGVGRTGTFIVVDAMLQRIAAEKTVDVFGFVMSLRRDRNIMVQVEEQYVFIHDVLLEAIHSGYTEIRANDLRAHIKDLMQVNPASGEYCTISWSCYNRQYLALYNAVANGASCSVDDSKQLIIVSCICSHLISPLDEMLLWVLQALLPLFLSLWHHSSDKLLRHTFSGRSHSFIAFCT